MTIIINCYLIISFLVSMSFIIIMNQYKEGIAQIWNMETTDEQKDYIFKHPIAFQIILSIAMMILGLCWPVTISTLINYYKQNKKND